MNQQELRFNVSDRSGEVSALLDKPENPRWLLVLGHGAGAGMRHFFMQSLSRRLVKAGIATFRYQFPYLEKGRRRPDAEAVLRKTVRVAIETARLEVPDLPLLAGGKSMGGRMTSLTAALQPLPHVRGLIFFGFPLHAPGKPGSQRGEHLLRVEIPMLFLQGTRDRLADLSLLRPLCRRLSPRARLHLIEDADHSFHLPKRSGKTDESALDELVKVTADWTASL